TCYNRFVRWRRVGVWAKIMNALAGAHDAAVQMIDTSIVRVHQHGACIIRNRRQSMGRSRGGLTSKLFLPSVLPGMIRRAQPDDLLEDRRELRSAAASIPDHALVDAQDAKDRAAKE